VAKLSDALQASVRLEQARFNVVQSEGELANAMADLNSLLGRPLEAVCDLEGSLVEPVPLPDLSTLSQLALQRPEVRRAENAVKIAESNKRLETSPFLPTVSARGSYVSTDTSLSNGTSREDQIVGLTATWNIFELGKFYRRNSAALEIEVANQNLDETKRQLLLNLQKTRQDCVTALENLKVAEQQLRQAEQNYAQAFGEYKIGKGDILSVVVAEGLLANAREQRVVSQFNVALAKSLLERVAGISDLSSLQRRSKRAAGVTMNDSNADGELAR
jgi:outer membrane protein TolC